MAEVIFAFEAGVKATADEIAAWGTLTPLTLSYRLRDDRLETLSTSGADTVKTSVGLFGTDLTSFLDDCTTAALL